MKCVVKLFNAGTVFEEIVIAKSFQEAQKTALVRNPGAIHVSTTLYNGR
jgi:hypothetical protein